MKGELLLMASLFNLMICSPFLHDLIRKERNKTKRCLFLSHFLLSISFLCYYVRTTHTFPLALFSSTAELQIVLPLMRAGLPAVLSIMAGFLMFLRSAAETLLMLMCVVQHGSLDGAVDHGETPNTGRLCPSC